MKVVNKALPILLALFFVSGLSYYLFTEYKPDLASQVKGVKSSKHGKSYLDSIPMPSDTQEVGRNTRDGFSQLTVSSTKSAQEILKFFRSVLVSKGWNTKDSADDLLSNIYTRDGEKIEISVLSSDEKTGAVFSVSYFN